MVCARLRPPLSASSVSAGLPVTGPVATGVEPGLPLPARGAARSAALTPSRPLVSPCLLRGAARPAALTPSRPHAVKHVCGLLISVEGALFPQQMLQATAHLQPFQSCPHLIHPHWACAYSLTHKSPPNKSFLFVLLYFVFMLSSQIVISSEQESCLKTLFVFQDKEGF